MNINILKQCKIFILLLSIFKEHFDLLKCYDEDNQQVKLNEFRENLINFNLLDFIVKFFDYENMNLLKTAFCFLIEIMDENIAQTLIKNGLLKRISTFLYGNDVKETYTLLFKMFYFPKVRNMLTNN